MEPSPLGPWIAFGSLFVSLSTPVLSVLVLHSKASKDRVMSHEDRIAMLEQKLEDCERDKLRLLERLVKLEVS